MSKLNPDSFEEILDKIKDSTCSFVNCGDIRALESNFNTKAMEFNIKREPEIEGMVIAGEDRGLTAIDVSMGTGEVRSFILRDGSDIDGVQNVVGWFKDKFE